jgi:outer membrane protein OmpA-like peptidoglycan-associated protein
MIQEKRKFQRSSIFLIANFRNLKSLQQHSSGITANFSQEGIGLESQDIVYEPGEILEILLKDPHSELSVSAEGEIVWRRDRWFKREMGIKFRQVTPQIKSEMLVLISSVNKTPAGSPLPDKDNRKSEAGKKDEKTVSVNPVRPDGPKIKAAKRDETIYISATGRKIADRKDSVIDGLMLNDKVNKKPSGEKTKTHLKKELRSNSGEIILKETSINKNQLLIVFLTVLSIVSLVAAALNFDYIRKAVSFNDSDQSEISDVKEPAESLQVPNNQDINHASLTGETKSHVKYPSAISEAKQTTETGLVADTLHKSPSVNEDMLQVNDFRATIIFDYNSDIINPVFYSKIRNITKALLASPKSIVKIEGYTDSTGPEMYNLDLSMRRSVAVKKMLIREGIDNARIKFAFFGESNPAVPNQTVSGRMRNRRVEMFVVSAVN